LRSEIKISVSHLTDARWSLAKPTQHELGIGKTELHSDTYRCCIWGRGLLARFCLLGCCTKLNASSKIHELSWLRLHIFVSQILKQCLCWYWNQKGK